MSLAISESKPRIIAVGGGKGGTGKSLLAANIGIFLATLGKRVVVVDGALGSANLHTFTGLSRPERTLGDALAAGDLGQGQGMRSGYVDRGLPVSLREVVSPTPVPGLRLIAGARDPLWMTKPEPEQVRQLMSGLRELDADVIVIDLAGGSSGYVLDLFLAADVGVLVAVPEPTSIELCYRFMRAAFLRQLATVGLAHAASLPLNPALACPGGIPAPLDMYLAAGEHDAGLAAQIEAQLHDFVPYLVINSARSKADMEMGPAVALAGRRRLGLPVTYVGHLEYDEAVWVAVRQRRPLLVEHPEARVSKCIEKVARRLIARDIEQPPTSVGARESSYDLLDVAPTASFEDIRRANRRVREIYGRESVIISGLYNDEQLDTLYARFENAYTTLMDASKRKSYDMELFPEGVPAQHLDEKAAPPIQKVEMPPAERPPMPALDSTTVFTGSLLKQIREAVGAELREISERTKIGMAYLQALEDEIFKKLPAAVYVRGFLVEYSKYLRLDTERVLETYLDRYRAARHSQEESWRKSAGE